MTETKQDTQKQEPPKPKHPIKIEQLADGRWRGTRGRIRIFFTVSDTYHVTFQNGEADTGTKSFIFENSDPFTIANLSKLMNAIAWEVAGKKKAAEAKAKKAAQEAK